MSVPLLAFLLAFLGLARAADDGVVTATKYPVVNAEWRGYHVVGDELVGVKATERGATVQRWDLGAPALLAAAPDDLPSGHRIEGVQRFGADLVAFSTHWDPAERAERLYHRTWDRAAGRFSEPTLAFAIPGKLLGVDVTGLTAVRQDITPRVKLSPSQDGRALLASWRPGQDDEKPARLGFALLGKDLAVRWQVEVEIPLTLRQFYLWDETVDNAGNAWFLIALPEQDLEDRWGRPLSKRVVAWRVPAGSATPEPILFEMAPDAPLRGARLVEVPGKGMFVVGITSTRQGASGLFMGRLSAGKLVDAVVHPLPPDALPRSGILPGLELDEVTFSGDGHLVLLAEQVDLTIIKGQANEYKSRYRDLIVAHLAAEGTLHWVRRLPKTQVGTRRPGSLSHVAFDGGDHLWVLYLDDLRNLSLPEGQDPEKYADGEHGQPVACRIDDATGEITRRAVLTTEKGAGRELHQLDITRIVPISASTVVVEAYVKQGEDQLIRVPLEGP